MIYRSLGQLAAAYAATLGGSAGPVTFGTISSTSGTGTTFTDPTYPSGLTAGDLIIMFVMWADGGLESTMLYDDDWLEFACSRIADDTFDACFRAFFKVSDGTETGTITGFSFTSADTDADSKNNFITNTDDVDSLAVATLKVSNVSRINLETTAIRNTAIPTITSQSYEDGDGSVIMYKTTRTNGFNDPTEFDSFVNVAVNGSLYDLGFVVGEKEHSGSGTMSATASIISSDSTSHAGVSSHMLFKGGTSLDARYPKEVRRNFNAAGPSVTISPSSGDLIVAFLFNEDTVDKTSSMGLTQTGFTTIVSENNPDAGDLNMVLHYKVSDGTETTISQSTTLDSNMIVAVFEGLSYVSSSAAVNSVVENAPNVPPSQTGATAGDLVLTIGTSYNNNIHYPSLASKGYDYTIGHWLSAGEDLNTAGTMIGELVDTTATWTSSNDLRTNSTVFGSISATLLLRPT